MFCFNNFDFDVEEGVKDPTWNEVQGPR
jgi:hypothetical protein